MSPSDVKLVATGSLAKTGQLLRVYSSRHDLTGYQELGWVVDAGQQVGPARCTQRIRLSPGQPVLLRPTLLLCWRTSSTKSVYTVLVDIDKKPSTKYSLIQIEKAWKKLE